MCLRFFGQDSTNFYILRKKKNQNKNEKNPFKYAKKKQAPKHICATNTE